MSEARSESSAFSVPNSRIIDFESSVNGREYRLLIAMPLVPAPDAGYRTLFLLDGNRYFGSATEAVRCNFNAPDVMVVGIGYPESDSFVSRSVAEHGPLSPLEADLPPALLSLTRERTFDFTLPVPRGHAFPGVPENPARTGGIDAFLEMIEIEIKPRIAALAAIDEGGSALFGHSLGGLAVLHCLFTRTAMFRNYIAASPSIWWADSAVLQGEKSLEAALARGDVNARILVTMGADESTPLRLPPGRDPAEAFALLRYAAMVENGRALVERLSAKAKAPGFEVAGYAVFEHQGHGISVWPAIGRAVEFAFQR
jgi:predicted alpha/beta superfamily hydrolase